MSVVAAIGRSTDSQSEFSERTFLGVSALLFASSVVMTIVGCVSMSTMSGMPMPGGWTMPMTWMRMPGQTSAGAATSFLGMWIVMMVAMMLPSLMPMLRRYRRTIGGNSGTRLDGLSALAGAGYFFVWTLWGVFAFALGVALTTVEMQLPALARTVPIAGGVVILVAGALQFTSWKSHHLACCREGLECDRARSANASNASAAWRHGLRLGIHCSYCCAGQTAMLLVLGVMNLRVMAVVTAAITSERFAPAGTQVARTIGVIFAGTGLFLIAQASGVV